MTYKTYLYDALQSANPSISRQIEPAQAAKVRWAKTFFSAGGFNGRKTAMHDEAIFQKLGEHHANIRAGIEQIRRHCEAVTPDIAGLGAARLRLSKASAARSKFVVDQVMPKVQQGADEQLRGELTEMQRAFAAKRLKSSEHVTVWSSAAIERDWQGYRTAARQIWAMMEEQMGRESRILGARLKRP